MLLMEILILFWGTCFADSSNKDCGLSTPLSLAASLPPTFRGKMGIKVGEKKPYYESCGVAITSKQEAADCMRKILTRKVMFEVQDSQLLDWWILVCSMGFDTSFEESIRLGNLGSNQSTEILSTVNFLVSTSSLIHCHKNIKIFGTKDLMSDGSYSKISKFRIF